MARMGFDWRPYTRATDPGERLLEVAVAMRAAEMIERDREIERMNLATEVGGKVGRHVGHALTELGKAFR